MANVHIRVTDEEKEMLNSLAKSYGQNLTDFIMLMAEYVKETRPTFKVKQKPVFKSGKAV